MTTPVRTPGASTSNVARRRAWRVALSLSPLRLSVLVGVVFGVASVVYLQAVVGDYTFWSRSGVVGRGMSGLFPYLLLIGTPIVASSRLATMSIDRGWIATSSRTPLPRFVMRAVVGTFASGFATILIASTITIVGGILISFEPQVFYTAIDRPEQLTDLSASYDRFIMSEYTGVGILSPVAGSSLTLFYLVLAVWTGVWGGLHGAYAAVFSLVLPWPRIAVLIPFAWGYALNVVLADVSFGIGAVDYTLAVFPMMSSIQPWPIATPLIAAAIYLLPAVVCAIWIWRRPDQIRALT
ncbi:hypothetical protein [Brachybacterium sp. UMB0905]|uniref:hypothetical protein n=1 Tax=Brachybacterium sp. UMB0905 TaxID=2069310 RepID=UPI000C805BB3|nr:hypothetical protein [Brachybacterium sp. UMB0905]PMC76945.1 hypothetical protein CJ197_01145 [Brachybacterium sp. UMB0905]